MKFNVTFRCSLPIDFDEHPVGEELAEYLAARFREQALDIQVNADNEDYAWLLTFKERSATPYLYVGYVDDGVFEWLALIESGVGWFGRMLGRSDQELKEEVTWKLHEILSKDPYFSEIRWHEGDFSEEGWSPRPA